MFHRVSVHPHTLRRGTYVTQGKRADNLMDNETERSTDKEREWPAWAGSMEELHRIGVIVEQMDDSRRKAV